MEEEEQFSFIRQLCKVFEIQCTQTIKNILFYCELNTHHSLKRLKDIDYLNLVKVYFEKADVNNKVSVGVLGILLTLGEEVSNLSLEEFNNKVTIQPKYTRKFKGRQQEYPLLNKLMKQTENYQYDKSILNFALLLRLLIGPQPYQLLVKNLGFPSKTKVDNFLKQFDKIDVGKLQVYNKIFESV